MGKFNKKRAGGSKPNRNIPLAEQLQEEKSVRRMGREKLRRRHVDDDNVSCRVISVSWAQYCVICTRSQALTLSI